ncbi:MAG: NAD(P)/FAD-dependent oxidoreductase, partial [Pseudomonadota bacterium]
ETDKAGRVRVLEDLTLPGHPEVSIVGDAAKIPWKDASAPGIAPAAKQAGKYVGKRLKRIADGKAPAEAPFKYRHKGNLATIGRNAAVIDFGWLRMSGAFAWWLWGFAHVYFLIGVRRPVFVLLSWFWSYLTRQKGARLITGLRPLFQNGQSDSPAEPAARKKAA